MMNRREACTLIGGTIFGLPLIKYHAPIDSILRIENFKKFRIDKLNGIISRFCGNDNFINYKWIISKIESNDFIFHSDDYLEISICDVGSQLEAAINLNSKRRFLTSKLPNDIVAYGYINNYFDYFDYDNSVIVPNYYDFGF